MKPSQLPDYMFEVPSCRTLSTLPPDFKDSDSVAPQGMSREKQFIVSEAPWMSPTVKSGNPELKSSWAVVSSFLSC